MANITLAEAQAWLEQTKLTQSSLDLELEAQVASTVVGRVAKVYVTEAPTWTTSANTPDLVRSVIAMMYAASVYDRQYSEDPDGNTYARQLLRRAEAILAGIVEGTIDLIDVPGVVSAQSGPAYYPNDASSALSPTSTDPSLGPEKFTMGVVW